MVEMVGEELPSFHLLQVIHLHKTYRQTWRRCVLTLRVLGRLYRVDRLLLLLLLLQVNQANQISPQSRRSSGRAPSP